MDTKLNRIFLVRHGYSMGNDDADNYAKFGDTELSLHDRGWEQVIKTGQFLADYIQKNPTQSGDLPRLWTSPFRRTQETTAGIIHGANGFLDTASTRETPYLAEQNFGIFSHIHNRDAQADAMPVTAEFIKRSANQSRFMTRKPLGDSALDISVRVDAFLGTLHRDANKGVNEVICISHGVTTRVFAMRVMHMSMRALDHFKNPGNGDVMMLQRKSNGTGFDLYKIYDGETAKPVQIDLGAQLFKKVPKLSTETLPKVPSHLGIR